jgi:hypothetical protein
MVRARWTARRARLWWAQLLGELLDAAVRQLGVDALAVLAVDVEDPGEHSWSRRRFVLVRVRLVYLVLA